MNKITNKPEPISADIFQGRIPPALLAIDSILRARAYEVYLVGGAVRDLLLDNSQINHIKDYDFATNALPEEVQKIFREKGYTTIPTGIKHGTVTLMIDNEPYEITTYRVDGAYTDGRRPDEVNFSRSIIEDLSRRDFTINAMAYNIQEQTLIDPFEGLKDLRERIIRTVGDPVDRFSEDGLRPIRACRFAAVLECSIDQHTLDAIPLTLEKVRTVSMERVHDEMFKLMYAPQPSIGLEYMRITGLLEIFIPELLEGYDIEQNEFHKYDIYHHNIYACDAGPRNQPLIRFAALFHDIGKARAKEYALKIGNGNVFYNHEVIGEKMAYKIMRRLKFSNHDLNYVKMLVKMHMFYYTDDWTDGAVRRFLKKIDGNMDTLSDLFRLRRADRIGSGMRNGDAEILKVFKKRIDTIMERDSALKVTDLNIDGSDLMQAFDLKPGPIIGEILNYLLEQVLDDPDLNQKEKLLELSGNYVHNTI